MCFSAEASFVASAALGVAGVVALNNAREPKYLALAAIPFIFSLQQFAEGLVWLSFAENAFLAGSQVPVYVFLFFALVVWPVWIPYAVWLTESNEKRKKTLFYLLLTGCAVSGILTFGMLVLNVYARAEEGHINYSLGLENVLEGPQSLIYFIPSLIPPFLASNKKLIAFGLGLLLAYLVARIAYPAYIVSVWCYFGALISIIVLWIVTTAPVISFSNRKL